MTALQIVENALMLTHARQQLAPHYELFTSIAAQLEYLLSVLNGTETDRSRIKSIIVGHFAVREFDESDPELAEALSAAQNIASKMSRGLKV